MASSSDTAQVGTTQWPHCLGASAFTWSAMHPSVRPSVRPWACACHRSLCVGRSAITKLPSQVEKTVKKLTVQMPYQLFIGGEFVDAEGSKTYDTINPTDGSVSAGYNPSFPPSFHLSSKGTDQGSVLGWMCLCYRHERSQPRPQEWRRAGVRGGGKAPKSQSRL